LWHSKSTPMIIMYLQLPHSISRIFKTVLKKRK
jgi:hypothetical protein